MSTQALPPITHEERVFRTVDANGNWEIDPNEALDAWGMSFEVSESGVIPHELRSCSEDATFLGLDKVTSSFNPKANVCPEPYVEVRPEDLTYYSDENVSATIDTPVCFDPPTDDREQQAVHEAFVSLGLSYRDKAQIAHPLLASRLDPNCVSQTPVTVGNQSPSANMVQPGDAVFFTLPAEDSGILLENYDSSGKIRCITDGQPVQHVQDYIDASSYVCAAGDLIKIDLHSLNIYPGQYLETNGDSITIYDGTPTTGYRGVAYTYEVSDTKVLLHTTTGIRPGTPCTTYEEVTSIDITLKSLVKYADAPFTTRLGTTWSENRTTYDNLDCPQWHYKKLKLQRDLMHLKQLLTSFY